MPSKLNADTAVEYVTNEWLARRAAHSPTTDVQKGGPGPLVAKRSYTHYKGSRISTDGVTIYSYTTPLLSHSSLTGEVIAEAYYANKEYSPTTARQIRIINRILATRNIEVTQ